MAEETGLPYLRDVLDTSQFKFGRANIIVAPCHSGKTTAAGKIIAERARCPERVLYLIDTTAGKQALLSRKDTAKFTRQWSKDLTKEWWGDAFDRNGFRVMSYHHFGYEIQRSPLFVFDLDLIICDEMHNLIKFIGIEHANNKRIKTLGTGSETHACLCALTTLAQAATRTSHTPLIVIMTATVNSLSVFLDSLEIPFETFDYTNRVRCDQTKQTIYYSDFEKIIQQLDMNTKAIIYVPQINQMKKYAELVDDGWRNICCLWSIRNGENQLDEYQTKVRAYLLKHERIPDDVDLLFINASYETSLNIRNEDFNTMIVHSGNTDTQTQVRGRLRHDIDTLYLYDINHEHIAGYFPEEYYDRLLYAEDTKKIAALMNSKNEKGRKMKWPSIYRLLQKDGITVNKLKKAGKRCWMVHRKTPFLNSEPNCHSAIIADYKDKNKEVLL